VAYDTVKPTCIQKQMIYLTGIRMSYSNERFVSCTSCVFNIVPKYIGFDIHSFSILSDDRSNASSKTVPPHSAI
jgi:hypothetical protein